MSHQPPNLPYSLEAEQAVLGSILVYPLAYWEIASFLEPKHFYLQAHKMIYQNASLLAETSGVEGIDTVTLAEKLTASKTDPK